MELEFAGGLQIGVGSGVGVGVVLVGDVGDREDDGVGEVAAVDVVEAVSDIAASAPRPAMGMPSLTTKGEPTSQTGWSWPPLMTRELQQYWLMPAVLFRRMMEHPLPG